ncbi:MAG: B12-binding domain-containing radical SAM protein [Candidatus Helarchaeota archaeon]
MNKIFIDPKTNANTNVPNIGLAYISAALFKLKIPHKIIDQDMMPFPKDRFLKEKGDFGISVKFNTLNEVKRITKLIHKKYPKSRIIWGGPHMRNKKVVENLKKEFPYVEFKAGYYDQELLNTNNLDEIPFPRYENFDSFDFIFDNFRTGFWRYSMMTSRGCPFNCTFCNSDKIFRARSANNCIEELKYAKKQYKIKGFQILDDNFIMIKKRAINFCEKVKLLDMDWILPNGIRADLITEELAKKMWEAGCKLISFGIECTDEEVLKKIKKGETFAQIEKGVKIAKKYFQVNGFFIIGLPGSSYKKDLKSYEWAKQMRISAHFGLLVPIPGTEIETNPETKKYINYELLDKAIFFDDKNEMICAYETPDYPAEKRIELYNKFMGYRK